MKPANRRTGPANQKENGPFFYNEEMDKEKLPPELYRVAYEKGTEVPFTGKYVHEKAEGMYRCAVCGSELFSSEAKFDSGTGWPSFTEPANLNNIELKEDLSGGMRRTEVLCRKCGAHLGHVFDDGPRDGRLPAGRQGKRYCINSVCLDLEKKE
ncbi:MAG: Peptide methionine sulfoxide reductase MsrB [Candidatus Jorgensenbacteria bacterium GW2011_GWA1_48_13]|uniref:peptide-methionine (R)-S-oxide reductase n=1 Tax=Candidatus Jorgensenbacteria bacterium GW2011_GWB1_50_10 TaxID=1618665 RepID=A0A0G1W9G6_9BACT|nr:MAG: Peptide methionine sulfoxide reductase MsrB [Candidatus Jorgensenbacteria bacterium GW2011_GWA1_48_13]KKW15441.1 MAG: Peptide methionine sulfoxide reductase MsrB [Candidatus Jorgensenbacteria bacterium GW2011_GWB1_50_10]